MYDINEEKGTHYITMEYVAGEDSKSFIKRAGRLTISKAISIAKQVCDGLSEAHKSGVMHRDLKPSNIMIDKEGNARIMDFGIARSIKGKGLTGKGMIIGTPEYMSPEQVEAKEIDQRSDLYSLGVILYEMVTGRVPFEGDTPLSVAVKQKTEKPPDPTKFNTEIKEDLRNVILKCLDKDKQKRYQNTRELRQELTNIEKGIPATDSLKPKRKPITSREITVTFGLKKFLVPILIIIALVISTIIIKQFLPKKELISVSSHESCLGVLYFENLTGDQSLDHLRIAFPEMMITNLSQAKHIRILRLDEINSLLRELDLVYQTTYSTEDWKGLAQKGGINHIVRGSYIKTGDNYRITTTLINVETGETLLSLFAHAETEKNLPVKLDNLAEEIRMKVDVPPENRAIEQAIEDFGTTIQIKKK
jgi:serine/threonine protein kinase